jgi:voltage-gated potassium channel Kch
LLTCASNISHQATRPAHSRARTARTARAARREPKAITLGDGLWLAFTTAATVGYGDIVPSTPASKIFSVFVVMLGYGVLSLVTAAIATRWIGTEERIIEREILRGMHHEMLALKQEIAALRQERPSRRDTSGSLSNSRDSSG